MIRKLAALGLVASAFVIVTTLDDSSPAQAEATPSIGSSHSGSEMTVSMKVDDAALIQPIFDSMSLELTQALNDLENAPVSDAVSQLEWDETAEVLRVYVTGAPEVLEPEISDILPAGGYEVRSDPYSRSDLISAADRIVRSVSIDGLPVVYGGPRVDGSGLEIGVEFPQTPRPAEIKFVERALADGFSVPYPVTVVPSLLPMFVDRQFHNEPYLGGALISSKAPSGAGFSACSSGFAVMQPAVPSSNYGMLFADHCGGVGRKWNSGLRANSPYFGTAQGTNAGGSDIRRLSGPVSYWGVNFVGAPNSNDAVAVKGYSRPVVGQSWCINGSQSGTVCNNTVTSGPQAVNVRVGDRVVTYSNQYRTTQVSGVPAAGNGDSGGPVFRVVEDQLYAAGIVSAISGGGQQCTGMPATATRRCSSDVWTAGLDAFFKNNSNWRILTYEG